MNVLLALIPVTLMLIAITVMAASHVLASLDIREMEQCVKVNIHFWEQCMCTQEMKYFLYHIRYQ